MGAISSTTPSTTRSPHCLRGGASALVTIQSERLFTAAVVLKQGSEAAEAELRTALRKELSAYKVPRRIFFCRDAELPFTDSGKIDKRRLTEMLTARIASEDN